MYKPMQDLSKMTDSYSRAAVGYERICEVLETESEVRDLPGARPRRAVPRAASNSTTFASTTIPQSRSARRELPD